MKPMIAAAGLVLSMMDPALSAESELKITRAGARPVTTAPSRNFTGAVKVEMLYAPAGPGRDSAGGVLRRMARQRYRNQRGA